MLNLLVSYQMSGAYISRKTKDNGCLILYIREIKDSDDPSGCAYDHFLSPAGIYSPIPTLMWQPAHSPPGAVKHDTEYPAFAHIQIDSGTAPIRVYKNLC
jgi:hypothetical protein